MSGARQGSFSEKPPDRPAMLRFLDRQSFGWHNTRSFSANAVKMYSSGAMDSGSPSGFNSHIDECTADGYDGLRVRISSAQRGTSMKCISSHRKSGIGSHVQTSVFCHRYLL